MKGTSPRAVKEKIEAALSTKPKGIEAPPAAPEMPAMPEPPAGVNLKPEKATLPSGVKAPKERIGYAKIGSGHK